MGDLGQGRGRRGPARRGDFHGLDHPLTHARRLSRGPSGSPATLHPPARRSAEARSMRTVDTDLPWEIRAHAAAFLSTVCADLRASCGSTRSARPSTDSSAGSGRSARPRTSRPPTPSPTSQWSRCSCSASSSESSRIRAACRRPGHGLAPRRDALPYSGH